MATACIAALSKQRFWMHSKREQWAEHVQAWRVNGLSQVAWCREQGLSLASFGYWRRRLAKGPVAPAGELPLRVQPVAAPDSAATVQLHLAGGCGCRWCRSIRRGWSGYCVRWAHAEPAALVAGHRAHGPALRHRPAAAGGANGDASDPGRGRGLRVRQSRCHADQAAVLRPPGGSLPDCARAWTGSGCLSRRWQVPRRCNSGMLTAWIDALPLPSTTRRRCVRRCWRCSPSAMRHWLRMVR